MSSNYTGDPTATQAPSPAPGGNVFPIVVLPSDGDALAAASVAQMAKVTADFIAWFNSVAIYNPAFSGVDTNTVSYTDNFGVVGDTIDHCGYNLNNSLIKYTENWMTPGPGVTATSAGQNTWFFTSNCTADTFNPSSGGFNSPLAKLASTGASVIGNNAYVLSARSMFKRSILCMAVFECYAYVHAIGANGFSVSIGLSDMHVSPVTTAGNSAVFQKQSTDTNWQAVTGNASALTTTDTGITPVANTPNKFRIEVWGSATGHGNKVRFFIDGTLVATHTTNLPLSTAYITMFLGYYVTTNSTAGGISVGRTNVVWNGNG